MKDTEIALSKIKNGQSLGPGNIPVELLKAEGLCLVQIIAKPEVPSEWKKTYLILICKKGNRKNPNCYVGLSVNCSISRLYGKIIQRKINVNIVNLEKIRAVTQIYSVPTQ